MKPSQTIVRAAFVVSAGILLSRVIGFFRNVIIGASLGLTVESDLYAAAFLIPDWVFFMMAGGYLSITLVPILARRLVDGDADGARRSFTAVFRVVATLMLIATVGAFVAAEPLTRLVYPEFAAPELGRLVGMMRIAIVSQLFFVGGTLLMAAQYASKRFLVPTLAPLIYNISIIAGGLIGAASGEASPEAFVWGGLVGAIVGNFGLQWFGAHRAGFWLVGDVPRRHPAVREYLTLALPLMVGQSAVALDEQWPRLFGQFVGEGAQAGLTFARQLNMLPVGVIAQAVGVAAFPFLAALAAEGRVDDLRATVVRSARGALVVGALAGGLVTALAEPLVTVAYQYGRFDAAASAFVAPLLFYYAFSIPFWGAHQVYTRAFYALRRMWVPVVIGTVITVLTLPTMWYFVDRNGAPGVAGTSTLAIIVYTVAIAATWHLTEARSGASDMVWFALKVSVVAVAAGVAATLARMILEDLNLERLVTVLAQGLVGTLAYLGLAHVVGIDEVTDMIRKLAAPLRTRRTAG